MFGLDTRKLVALVGLGFASGLPLFLTDKLLQAWLTVVGVDLKTIGFASLVGLPYTLKFLWSPLIDRFAPPWLGRRRGWLLLTQGLLIGAIALMGLQNPTTQLSLLLACALGVALLSATQDIAFDAYRTDVLTDRELGPGAAAGVLGYRLALLAVGAGAFFLADFLPWSTVYVLLALGLVPGLIMTVWVAPEPPTPKGIPTTLEEAFYLPFREFFGRAGLTKALLILGFILLYKLGDTLVNTMSTPFLLKTGYSLADLGAVQGGVGLGATILGVVAGGTLLTKLGVYRSLWIFGALQAGSNLAYYGLAVSERSYPLLVGAITVENFCTGLGTAAFVAFLMSLCNSQFSATQYALLSSLTAVGRTTLAAPAGEWATLTGWPVFFLLTLVAALPGLLLLPFFAPWRNGPDAPLRGESEP